MAPLPAKRMQRPYSSTPTNRTPLPSGLLHPGVSGATNAVSLPAKTKTMPATRTARVVAMPLSRAIALPAAPAESLSDFECRATAGKDLRGAPSSFLRQRDRDVTDVEKFLEAPGAAFPADTRKLHAAKRRVRHGR